MEYDGICVGHGLLARFSSSFWQDTDLLKIVGRPLRESRPAQVGENMSHFIFVKEPRASKVMSCHYMSILCHFKEFF